MKKKKTSLLFKIIKGSIRLFYGKMEVAGMERLPSKHAIIVANHCQMNGPIAGELFMPDSCYIWCAGQMMNFKEVPEYAFQDFWAWKPKWTHPFYKVLAHLIAPLSVCIFNNARTIAVYRDMRIMSTFKRTTRLLEEGAKLYYKKTGVELTFVPMYIAPDMRKMYIGQGIRFDGKEEIGKERTRIVNYLSKEITRIARELPRHRVVPYRNISKKHYLTNKEIMEVPR